MATSPGGWTPEQDELRRSVRSVLARLAPPERTRAVMAEPEGFDAQLWVALAEVGVPALVVPEEHDGAGAGVADLCAAAVELGAAVAVTPYLGTAFGALALLEGGRREACDGWLPRIAAGEVRVAVALPGALGHVVDGHVADLLLVPVGDAWHGAAPGDVSREAVATMDQTRRQARVTPTAAGDAVADAAAVERALDRVRVVLAAECVGGAQRCLDVTVEHLRTRVQFGRPLGSFQALKHRCADLFVDVELALSGVLAAAAAVDDGTADWRELALIALSTAAEAYARVAAETIQLHGGIGFTWEHEAHLHLKRAAGSRVLLGTPERLRAGLAAAAGLVGP